MMNKLNLTGYGQEQTLKSKEFHPLVSLGILTVLPETQVPQEFGGSLNRITKTVVIFIGRKNLSISIEDLEGLFPECPYSLPFVQTFKGFGE